MTWTHLHFLIAAISGWMNREEQQVIDYLREGNRVLREELGRKRIIPADSQELVDRAVANLLLTLVSGVVFPSAQRRLFAVDTAHFSKS